MTASDLISQQNFARWLLPSRNIAESQNAAAAILRSSYDPNYVWKHNLRAAKAGMAKIAFVAMISDNPLRSDIIYLPGKEIARIAADTIVAIPASSLPQSDHPERFVLLRPSNSSALSVLRCVPSLFDLDGAPYSAELGSNTSLSIPQAIRLAVAIAAYAPKGAALDLALECIEGLSSKSWQRFVEMHVRSASASISRERLYQLYRVNSTLKVFARHSLSLDTARQALIFTIFECIVELLKCIPGAGDVAPADIAATIHQAYSDALALETIACLFERAKAYEEQGFLSMSEMDDILSAEHVCRRDSSTRLIFRCKKKSTHLS